MSASTQQTMNNLSDCPSNLKEAIDWVLRVTEKDNGNGNESTDLAKAVENLIKEVLGDNGEHVKDVLGTKNNDGQFEETNQSTLVMKLVENGGTGRCNGHTSCYGTGDNICCLINKLGDVLKNF